MQEEAEGGAEQPDEGPGSSFVASMLQRASLQDDTGAGAPLHALPQLTSFLLSEYASI